MSGYFNDRNLFAGAIAYIFIFIYLLFGVTLLLRFVGDAAAVIGALLCFVPLILKRTGGRGSFTADEEKVCFRRNYVEHEYYYADIRAASVDLCSSYIRGDSRRYAKICLILKNGRTVKYTDAVGYPFEYSAEGVRRFNENLQFTKLCNYINNHLR